MRASGREFVLGFIGLGQQALSDFKGFAACPGVQVAACCDVDTMKTERFRRRVAEWQKQKGMNERCDKYEFYEDLLRIVNPAKPKAERPRNSRRLTPLFVFSFMVNSFFKCY